MRNANLCIALVLATFCTSCGTGGADLHAFGLDRVELLITDENLAQLFQGGKAKLSAPARLRVGSEVVAGNVSLSGNYTIDAWKRSYRFDSMEPIPLLGYRSVKISAQALDPTAVRVLLGAFAFKELSVPAPRVLPVSLYVNGQFRGLYFTIERIGSEFYASRGFDAGTIYQANPNAAGFDETTVTDPELGFRSRGGAFYPSELKRLAREATLPADASQLIRLEAALDLENALGYFAARSFIGDCDGIIHNYYMHRDRSDGRIRFTAWDWERAWDGGCVMADFRENRLFAKLMEHASLALRYRELLGQLATRYPPEKLSEEIAREFVRVGEAFEADPLHLRLGAGKDAARAILTRRVQEWWAEVERSLSGT